MRCLFTVATLLSASFLSAQDSYWIANRASADIMRVSAWGSVLERVATPTTLRSCTTSPDGKVWIVRFGSTTVDIYDPATQTFSNVVSPVGSAFQIAFDAAGHAWITNAGTAVHEFDASGTFVATYTTTVGAALGITIDADGNKWIAHRATPASLSRIDGVTGAVTNHAVGGGTAMMPTAVVADYRGLFTSSHIWVVGDSSGDLAEFDAAGNWLNTYPLGPTGAGSATFDAAGNIWVGNFSNGSLLQVDQTNGTILNSYTSSPSVNGLTTDHYGRLLATARVTFSGVGPPCELRRFDPATGTLEIPAKLESGGFAAAGSQAAASSQWQYCLVVHPTGDIDGDGELNYSEIIAGTSPVDASSNSLFRVESFGVTQTGSTPTFEVQTGSIIWVVGFASALLPAPATIPGFGGTLLIDPSLGVTAAGVGSASLPLSIGNNPALVDVEVFAQGVTYNGTSFDFRNLTGIKVW